MKTFYVIKPAEGIRFGTKWAYAEINEPSQDDDPDICPVCQEPVTLLKWIPPLNIKLSRSHPNGWGDFLWGAGFYLMVSDRFKEIYEKEGLT